METLTGATFIATKLRQLRSQLRHLPRTLALVWTAARHWTLAWTAVLLLDGLLPVATVYLTRTLVDAIVAAIRTGGAGPELRAAFAAAALMGAVLLAGEVTRAAGNWLRSIQAELVQDHLSSLIHRKSVSVDLAFYESPEFYDHMHRARAEATQRPIALIETLGTLVQNTITMVAMLGVLMSFGWLLPLSLVLSTLPALWVVLRYTHVLHVWQKRVTAAQRRAYYYDWLLTSSDTAPEIRLFGLGDHFRKSYQDVRRQLREGRLGLAKAQSKAELTAAVLAFAITAAALAWVLWRAVRGFATLGDLALLYQAFNQGLRLTRSLLESVGRIYQNTLFLGNLFEYLALEPRIVAPPGVPAAPVLRREIRFTDVTFHYASSGRTALDRFNVTIPAGSITAIVGKNGAGKSTLMKLLCRLYDPDTGRIEMDGVDLRAMSPDALRRSVTVLFQNPVHYNATVADNIALGDLESAPGAGRLRGAAEAAGAIPVIDRLPKGFDTLLGNWFETGTEMSTGEWQRIALARAFLRDASLLILDEPTSAMDPWAEAEWLGRFRELAAGRTAVIITHRFTTAMFADAIHVMSEGRILESGTHEELLKQNGLYAEGWRAQMRDHLDASRG